jgi:hypothetical protein
MKYCINFILEATVNSVHLIFDLEWSFQMWFFSLKYIDREKGTKKDCPCNEGEGIDK